MKTSVLFTIPNFITAGSGRAMLNIIERLDRQRFSPAVCVARKGGDLDAVVEEMGIPFLEANATIPVRPYVSLLPRAWKAARSFREHRFDLWHSFHYAADYSEPIIARMSGAKGWIYTKKNMSWRERAWRVRSHLASRIAAQNTDMLREFFATPALARKTRLVPRGVVTSRFSPGAVPSLRIRERLGLGPEIKVVTCVAQLLPVKGHPTLIEAMKRVPEAVLLLAGARLDKPYVESLEALVNRNGLTDRVHFLGSVKEVPALLVESDVFVLATWGRWGEGCPVALLEGMACGKACVATDIPGSRDLIEHQVSGLRVPPENPDALGQALRDLVGNEELRCRLGRAARERVLGQYSIEQEVTAHERLYLEICGN